MKEFENTFGSTSRMSTTQIADRTIGGSLVLPGISDFKREVTPDRKIPFNGLLTNKLLASLPGAAFARLLPHLEPVSLTGNQTISAFGDSLNSAYFPETAVITHIYFLEDGSTTAAAIIGNEGMVGLSAILEAGPQSYATQVTIGGTALKIDIDTLKKEFAAGGPVQQALLNYTGHRLAQLSQKAVCNGRHKLEERLCTWLLMVHDRAGQNRLRLTHEQIAHLLGARRAGITDACNNLRRDNIIHYRRGVIRIANRELLERAACECYASFRS